MIYLIVALIILIGVFRYDFARQELPRGKYGYFVFCGVVLVLLAGLRYRVGSDTIEYMYYYESQTPKLGQLSLAFLFDSKFEPGWILFTSFIKTLGWGFYAVQMIHALFFNTIMFKFIWKKCSYTFFAVLFYYVLWYINYNTEILRQALALAFFLLAYLQLEKHGNIKYYLLCSIGILFHYSAIITLAFPLFAKATKHFTKHPVIFTVIAILLYSTLLYYRETLMVFAMEMGVFEDKATFYFGDAENQTFNISFVFNILLNIVFPIYLVYSREKMGAKSDNGKGIDYFTSMCLISVSLYCLQATLPIVYRFNMYICFFNSYLIADSIPYIRKLLFGKASLAFLVLFAILAIKARVYFTTNELNQAVYNKYYPYTSIFNEEKVMMREVMFN